MLQDARLTWPLLAAAFEKKFCPELHATINKLLKKAGGEGIGVFSAAAAKADTRQVDEDESEWGRRGGGWVGCVGRLRGLVRARTRE
jgi:hypothetical protein